ncbi:LOW QUALITY PROTEIN: probable purple acid phosphatase 20 [Dioscorea cayenensis subsp. rotundata]|uniref:Purple acid phosphatase n=1 Tax=Dioscorea cayennensis subsp. rotundata TaxID=55577 RepID=A0AB40BA81_DIOCR|nr:LOW QUALITY PROTEIN: probable purple acid phosphatase 20 [Dioscorea cayenensis subsp. rotundata]
MGCTLYGPHVVLLALLLSFSFSLSYHRPPSRATLSIPAPQDTDGLTPQQVHVSLVGDNKMRITWITENEAPSTVDYGTSSRTYTSSATGSVTSYSFLLYTSGHIHDVIIGPLSPSTVYYYRCSSNSAYEFSFKTPPSKLPLKFAIVGDLGQTGWTNSTLQHLGGSDYDVLLLPGDLSYADLDQPLWDSYGRLIEPFASSRPWMVTEGNHEIEKLPPMESSPFKSYNARWRMPYDISASDSNLYYSFDVAGGVVHVLMLGSYTDFDSSSAQFKWLMADLDKIDRKQTPWLLALIHAPWYNSNEAHQGDGEDMRKSMENLLYQYKVDVVFAGHVHAYERFTRVYDNSKDGCGPMHVTIGDGGNREGLANKFLDPQPEISVFREASFGHGEFLVVNETHAHWTWHRNDDDEQVMADQVWVTTLISQTTCKNKTTK